MDNIVLSLHYVGTAYHGWQQQKNAVTVQETIQKAIYSLTGQRVQLSGCGRTDAGVHARVYAANAALSTGIPLFRLPFALNAHLPDDICVHRAVRVPDDFDARFSCVKKEYTYLILNSRMRDPFLKDRAGFFPYAVDDAAMSRAAADFVGTHDFAAMRTQGSDVKTTVRTVHHCSVSREGDLLSVRVCADGFLYNMVRAITGTLLYAGLGKIPDGGIGDILRGGERAAAGPTMPPCGLYLTRLWYNEDIL